MNGNIYPLVISKGNQGWTWKLSDFFFLCVCVSHRMNSKSITDGQAGSRVPLQALRADLGPCWTGCSGSVCWSTLYAGSCCNCCCQGPPSLSSVHLSSVLQVLGIRTRAWAGYFLLIILKAGVTNSKKKKKNRPLRLQQIFFCGQATKELYTPAIFLQSVFVSQKNKI